MTGLLHTLEHRARRSWRLVLRTLARLRRKYRNWSAASERARFLELQLAHVRTETAYMLKLEMDAEISRLQWEYEGQLSDQHAQAQQQIADLYSVIEREQRQAQRIRAAMRDNVSLILTHMQLEMLDLPDESTLEALEAVTPWNSDGADNDTGNAHILALFGFSPSSFTALSRRHYRRGLEYGRTEHPSPLELYQLWCRHIYPVCAYSGLPLTPEHTQLEHIVPLSAGGANHITNMVFVHGDLNASKGNKILDVWAQRSRLDRDWLGRRVEHIRIPSPNGHGAGTESTDEG